MVCEGTAVPILNYLGQLDQMVVTITVDGLISDVNVATERVTDRRLGDDSRYQRHRRRCRICRTGHRPTSDGLPLCTRLPLLPSGASRTGHPAARPHLRRLARPCLEKARPCLEKREIASDLPVAHHGVVGAKLFLLDLDEVVDVVAPITSGTEGRT